MLRALPFLGFLLACLALAQVAEASTMLTSPNGRIELTVERAAHRDGHRIEYRVRYDGHQLVAPSAITFTRHDGVKIGTDLTALEFEQSPEHRSEWKPIYGERSTVIDHYNEVVVKSADKRAGCLFTVTFRCYDAGVAFHTTIENKSGQVRIASEQSEFRFTEDPYVWRTTNAQGLYDKVRLSEMGDEVERPLVAEFDGGALVAINEAKLTDYARMQLQAASGKHPGAVSQISSSVVAGKRLATPWRVLMLAKSAGELLENNDIAMNLSDPCAIEDTSWVRPGKVLREMTLTTKGGEACIDFAVEHDFGYILIDAGWYGHEYDQTSDATTLTLDPKRSAGPFDLHHLIQYGKQRGIGVIVYINRRALERQLDDLLPLYKSWGLAGVKYGFVQVGSQKWTKWLIDAIKKAADHELLVDIHDEYRPTGFSRTYPNLLTQEGVRGDEASPTTDQTLTSLFTRYVGGAGDFTICYFNQRVDELWSHSQQLAKAVCFYSPWQLIFWYDSPLESNQLETIKRTPELEFFKHVPTVWDETRVLHGKISRYAVIARRAGADWYVGAISAEPQQLATPLGFLQPGRRYQAHIYSDDKSVGTVTGVRVSEREVTSETVLSIKLNANEGQAIRITPVSD